MKVRKMIPGQTFKQDDSLQSENTLQSKIEMLKDTGRMLTQSQPNEFVQEAAQMLKKSGELLGFSVVGIVPGERDSDVIIELKTPANLREHQIAIALHDVAMRGEAVRNIKKRKDEISKDKKRNNVFLYFDKADAAKIKEEHGEKLGIKSLRASMKPDKKVKLEFDLTGLETKQELFERAALVFDTLRSVVDKSREREAFIFLQAVKKQLSRIGEMRISRIIFERITGSELIERGLAKLMPAKNDTEQPQYIYQKEIVQPVRKYVVVANRKIDEPVLIDHSEEVDMRFEYGEAEFFGYGQILVKEYYDDIIAIHNEQVESLKA
jgi:hypothetical protein